MIGFYILQPIAVPLYVGRGGVTRRLSVEYIRLIRRRSSLSQCDKSVHGGIDDGRN